MRCATGKLNSKQRAANVQQRMAEGEAGIRARTSQQMQMYEALKAGISHADIVQRFGIKTGQVGQRVRQTALLVGADLNVRTTRGGAQVYRLVEE